MSILRNLNRILPLQPLLTESQLSAAILGKALQIRNTFILKRKWDPNLSRIDGETRKLQSKNYVYELVEDTVWKRQEDLKLIMTDDVEGIGSKGEIVSVRPYIGRHRLLAANKAIYASPENLAKLQEDVAKGVVRSAPKHSSPWAPKTARELSKFVLLVSMNMDEPWTLEPWHIRAAFRTSTFVVPEDAITLPIQPVTGPNADIENKEFLVKVTINSREEASVRCRIHHWTSNPDKAIPIPPDHWKCPAEPLFPEEAELIKTLPKPECLFRYVPIEG